MSVKSVRKVFVRIKGPLKRENGGAMDKKRLWDKGTLILPFAILMMAVSLWGCATGSSDSAAGDLESSTDEEIANSDGEGLKLEDEGGGDKVADATADATQTDLAATPAEPVVEKPAEAPPPPSPTGGFVGGKDGVAMEAGLPEQGSKMTYIVQKGDTLGDISARIYGDKSRWRMLAEFSAIKNPNLIYPGDAVYYQLDQTTVAFARRYENIEKRETQVRKGETLTTISKRLYADAGKAKFLWRLNDKITDPYKLHKGDTVYYVKAQTLVSLSKIFEPKLKSQNVKKKLLSANLKAARKHERKS